MSIFSSISNPSRSLDTPYQPSVTNDVLVIATVRVNGANSVAAQEGYIRVLSDSSNPPTTERGSRVGIMYDTADTINAHLGGVRGTLTMFVPIGHYIEFETVTDTGTIDFTLELTTEIVLNNVLAAFTAGDGLTLAGGVLSVNVGTGLEISSDAVRIAAAAAGDGLTGGAGSALAVNVGSGLEIVSDAIRIAAAAAGNGLSGGAGSALAVNVDGSTLEISGDALQVKNGGISTAKIGALQVTAAKVAADVATQAELDTEITNRVADVDAEETARIAADALLVPKTTLVTAGGGLTGGGDLSANRTFDVNPGSGISIVSDAVTALGAVVSSRSIFHPHLKLTAIWDSVNSRIDYTFYELDSPLDFGSMSLLTFDTTNSIVQVFEDGVQVGSDTAFSALTSLGSGVYRKSYTATAGAVLTTIVTVVVTLLGAPTSVTTAIPFILDSQTITL